jgi:DNA-directed RNA polymerase specialized sigma24 family protein
MQPLEQLVEQYRPALHAFARRWVNDPNLCDDLVQESIVLGWKKNVGFAHPRDFLAWSRKTLRYLAFAENRSAHRCPETVPRSESADDVDAVIACAERVARLNPGEKPRELSTFILHTVFHVGLRYLSYVLELPKSTVARRFDQIRDRMAQGPWDPEPRPGDEDAASRVVEELALGLVRERLMAAESRTAKETCGFPNELFWAALARFPAAQARVLCGIETNISYTFRRCAFDRDLDAERARVHGMAAALAAESHSERARVGAEYMSLRSDAEAPRERWQAVLHRMDRLPNWPSRITAIEHAHGWETAAGCLSAQFRRTEIDNSFYLSYLAAHYALRRAEPRVAHRHLIRILDFYCPEYFRPHIDELRAACVAAWHRGGEPIRVTSRLLA